MEKKILRHEEVGSIWSGLNGHVSKRKRRAKERQSVSSLEELDFSKLHQAFVRLWLEINFLERQRPKYKSSWWKHPFSIINWPPLSLAIFLKPVLSDNTVGLGSPNAFYLRVYLSPSVYFQSKIFKDRESWFWLLHPIWQTLPFNKNI